MALFEKGRETNQHEFPSLPAFLVPVEVRDVASIGPGHKGVFALESIPAKTKFWQWTDRINVIPQSELVQYIQNNFQDDEESIRIFLRQGFVLPSSTEKPNPDSFFYSNPTDAGRFMNHSSSPNCGPDGALRDIQAGEELTMDYCFHGNPSWYQDICEQHQVQTERQVAEEYSK